MKTFNQFLNESTGMAFKGSDKTHKVTAQVLKEFQTKFKTLKYIYKTTPAHQTTWHIFTDPAEKKHFVELEIINKSSNGYKGDCVQSIRHENSVLRYESVVWGIDEDDEETGRNEKSQLSMCASLLKWIKRFEG